MKTKEEKVYEFMGIIYFKKITISFGKSIRRILFVDKEIGGDNYFLYELSADAIKDFKGSAILFNSIVHVMGLLFSLYVLTKNIHMPMQELASPTLITVLHSYCIMLQRYNSIRLDRVYKMLKNREEKTNELETQPIKSLEKQTNQLECVKQSNNIGILYLKNIKNNLLEQQVLYSCDNITLSTEKEPGIQVTKTLNH